jgi:hypothetical protein
MLINIKRNRSATKGHLSAVCNMLFMECLDNSDHRLCPGSKCKNNPDYFRCKDDKFCIFNSLLCDGHFQCEDKSDENEEICSVCPTTNSTKERTRTYSCKHRYTGTPICANACDGIDDLCAGYTDEDCDGLSFLYIMLHIGVGIIFFSSIGMLSEKCYYVHMRSEREDYLNDQTMVELSTVGNTGATGRLNSYIELRENKSFINRHLNILFCHKEFRSHLKAAEFSLEYRKLEIEFNQGNVELTDHYYFMNFGTNTQTGYFYDILANSLGIRINTFFARICPTLIEVIIENYWVKKINEYGMFVLKILVHYADTTKDILLLLKIWNFMLGGNGNALLERLNEFPIIVFWVILFTIVASEMLNFVSLLHNQKFQSSLEVKYVLSILLCPIMPVVIHYKEFRVKVKQLDALEKIKHDKNDPWSNDLDVSLTKCRKEIQNLKLVIADLKAGENVVEHFVQFIILLLILLLQHTETAKVTRMDKIFLNKNDFFLYVSLIWSFISLLRGHISYIASSKNGCLGLLGKIILFCYFFTGLSGKLFNIVLFCTQILGLFDSNYHGYLSQLDFKTGYQRVPELYDVYDYHLNDTPIFFNEIWSRLQLNNSMSFNPTPIYVTLCAVFLLHIVLCSFLQSKLETHVKTTLTKIYFLSIYSLMSPPLFLDWEVIYRKNKKKFSVKESWRKSQKFLICNIMMHFVQHIIFCIPLIMQKISISARNTELTSYFVMPLKNELYSTYIVDVLLTTGIAVAFVLPPIQYSLAHLYFVKGHPWSRVLNAKINPVQPQMNKDF